MEAVNWLTAMELVEYHSLTTLWKILNTKKPPQLYDRFEWMDDRKISTSTPRLQTTSNYWRCRSTKYWNNLPDDLRYTMSISSFKIKLKKWLISRRSTETRTEGQDPPDAPEDRGAGNGIEVEEMLTQGEMQITG